MIKKIALFLLPFLFTFYSSFVFAQDISKVDQTSSSQRSDNKPYLKPSGLIIPGAFLVYGGLKPVINDISKLDDKIWTHMQENYPGFHTNAADFLMWVPSASIYAIDAFHVKTQHTFKEHLILDVGSILVTGGLGFGMRKISEHISAYNTHDTKFPSGHAANVFRGAEIVHQELKYTHPVLSYSGYVVATGVGLLRIYNKNHLLSEVITGAGLGILSTKLTYWIFGHVKEKMN
jgi:membrane-associated phospholipid phosphatase